MTVRLITPPAAEPVTLEMARLHTRAEAVEDDALLTVLITAARQQGEGVTRRVFGESVWVVETGPLTFPFRLPLVPCTAVASVTVGGEAVDAGLYGFTPSGLSPQESPLRAAFIPGPDFPQGETVLTVRAGYPADRFPEPIRQWMLVRIGTLYEQRESFAVGANFNQFDRTFVDCLLDPYVVAGGF
ncbi:head-tail connector protein [Bilophila wadsworthia]|uniref:head-tail connector protein n=1 Tax=Bilophila wadsworthia TaxID=35833 RepID=UPI003AAB378F